MKISPYRSTRHLSDSSWSIWEPGRIVNYSNSRRATPSPSIGIIAKEWTRIGVIGFGGPPTHITLFRRLCVEDKRWISGEEFEDAIAATNLLPGPASTQLGIFCAWRLRGAIGAIVGGFCFIAPGLILILMLAALFLVNNPPLWILGAALGSGAVVPAVAINAAWLLVPTNWNRIGLLTSQRIRWVAYCVAGICSAVLSGQFLVLVLIACGIFEVFINQWNRPLKIKSVFLPVLISQTGAFGSLGGLIWVAFKVGALSYGGGFVIIPLMQHDAVNVYHWMTGTQFLNAVALGQITPGPVVQTVAVVGYAAAGITGGLIAAAVAFIPSFLIVIGGGKYFETIRKNSAVQAFFIGAGTAVIGAIAGSAIALGQSFQHLWQLPLLGMGFVWLLIFKRGVVSLLLFAGIIGVLLVAAGLPN